MTTPDPPAAITLPNSSSTTAVPYRSTARIASMGAWLGETPAAWMRRVMSPWAAAVSTRTCTDSREDTSTVVVLTSNPALCIASAAASAFACRRSASTMCLAAPTRRAIAWPIDPGPMTTTTSLTMPRRRGVVPRRSGRSQRTDADERLDGAPFVHGGVRLGGAVEVGLVVEHEAGIDRSGEDVVEELGDVDASRGRTAAPADVAEERLVERHGAVGDADDADRGAGPRDRGGGLDRLLRADALEGGIDA